MIAFCFDVRDIVDEFRINAAVVASYIGLAIRDSMDPVNSLLGLIISAMLSFLTRLHKTGIARRVNSTAAIVCNETPLIARMHAAHIGTGYKFMRPMHEAGRI